MEVNQSSFRQSSYRTFDKESEPRMGLQKAPSFLSKIANSLCSCFMTNEAKEPLNRKMAVEAPASQQKIVKASSLRLQQGKDFDQEEAKAPLNRAIAVEATTSQRKLVEESGLCLQQGKDFDQEEAKAPLNRAIAVEVTTSQQKLVEESGLCLYLGQKLSQEEVAGKLSSIRNFKKEDCVLVSHSSGKYQVAKLNSINDSLCKLSIGQGKILYKPLVNVFSLSAEFKCVQIPHLLDFSVGQHLTRVEVEKMTDMGSQNNQQRRFNPKEFVVVYQSTEIGKSEYYQYARVVRQLDDKRVELECGEANNWIKYQECVYKLLAPDAVKDAIPREPIIEFAVDEEVSGDLQVENAPTLLNRDFLSNYSRYDAVTNTLLFKGIKYTPLTGKTIHISEKATASCGSSVNREVILMDPQRSPLLNQHCLRVKEELLALQGDIHRSLSELEILKFVAQYVRQSIFPLNHSGDSVSHFEAFIERNRGRFPVLQYTSFSGEQVAIPVISIDYCIELKNGICRHHGMVLAYLIDYLVKAKTFLHFFGIAQQMRDNIQGQGHIWVTFMSQSGKKWMIDSYLGKRVRVIDFSNPKTHTWITKWYGEEVLQAQIRRTEKSYALAISGSN